jgi:hypothetical protein
MAGRSDRTSLNCPYTTSTFLLNWWLFMLSQALIMHSRYHMLFRTAELPITCSGYSSFPSSCNNNWLNN